jgi:hypothetical protein
VRESVKSQLNARLTNATASDPSLQDNPFASFGSALALTMVEKVVDTVATPEGITRLMAGGNLEPNNTNSSNNEGDPFSVVSKGYTSFDTFTVTVKGDDGKDAKFILHRRGIGWKLTDIVLP